jgi:hypothetical protein
MEQSSDNLLKIDIEIEVEPMLTLMGRKYFYRLPDNAYGEWIIFENRTPKYYLNVFDKRYVAFLKKFEIIIDKETYLENIINKVNRSLTIKNHIWGIRCYSKSKLKTFSLEKLPLSFLQG